MVYSPTANGIRYTVNFLMEVAVPGGLAHELMIRSGEAVISVSNKTVKLPINCGAKGYADLIEGNAEYRRIPSLTGAGDIPFFYAKSQTFAAIYENCATVHGDIVTASFVMLSRCEELERFEPDFRGCFPAAASIACKYNFIDLPLVDEYALYLRKLLLEMMPELRIVPGKFRVIPTHDVDHIHRFKGKGAKSILRPIAHDLIREKNITLALRSTGWLLRSLIFDDQNTCAIRRISDFSKAMKLRSEFYFMAAEPDKYDEGYTYSKEAIKVLKYIQDNGSVAGFHPGYHTMGDPDRFQAEKKELERVLGRAVTCGRQHYLKFNVLTTFETWENAGMLQDSTLGYNEREGFRCGTCHAFHPYDLKRDKPFETIVEKPLITMDGTLIGYRNMTPRQSLDKMLELAGRCKRAVGNYVILLHPHSSTGANKRWFKEAYCGLLKAMADCEDAKE